MPSCKYPMKFALFLALALNTLSAATLPVLEGETLAGAKLTLPAALQGKPALLVIGFTKDSQKQTEAWSKRLKTDLPTLDIWSAADLEDAPRLIRPMIKSAMRSATPKLQHDHFLILTKGGKPLRAALSYDTRSPQNDDAYLVLIDPAGTITWYAHGPVSDATLTQLRQHLK